MINPMDLTGKRILITGASGTGGKDHSGKRTIRKKG